VRLIRVLLCVLIATASALATADDYSIVTPDYHIELPRDEGSHPKFRTEWWYVTGWLQDEQGVERGFQVTFFRSRSAHAEENPSHFAPSQLLFAHAALSDRDIGHLLHAQRAARAGFGIAEAASGRTSVVIDDWTMQQRDTHYHVQLDADDFSFDLQLEQTAPVILQGEHGVSHKGPDSSQASYYYTHPQLRVGGDITMQGHKHKVTGTAWFDHEWSSTLLDAQAQGWDWAGINLVGAGALTMFQIRDAQTKALWTSAGLRGGLPCKPSAAATADRTLTATAVKWTALRSWRSPRTGISYPVEWRVEVDGCAILLRPLMDDQESDARASTGTIYWEGAVRAYDERGTLVGRGYLELTGYGSKLRLSGSQ
jgi:predicted secreted hydrolase